jgi:hypothetical protein
MLPRTLALLHSRAPDRLADLVAAIKADPGGVEARVLQLGGNPAGLGVLGVDRSQFDQALDSMLLRPELAFTPGPPLTKADLAELLDRAW